jgi:hypothetical protein
MNAAENNRPISLYGTLEITQLKIWEGVHLRRILAFDYTEVCRKSVFWIAKHLFKNLTKVKISF